MDPALVSKEQYCVGEFLFDVDDASIKHNKSGSETLLPKLTTRAFTCLVRKAPNLVTRDELIEFVWEGKSTSDETMQQRIKLLRQSLGDFQGTQSYIDTVRGKGYRMRADVEKISENSVIGRSQSIPLFPQKLVVLIAMLIAIISFGVYFLVTEVFYQQEKLEANRIPVTVVPFVGNRSNESQTVADDLTRHVTELLDKVERFELMAPTTKSTQVSKAYLIVNGEVLLENSIQLITVRVLEGESRSTLWSRQFRGNELTNRVIENEIILQLAKSFAPSNSDGLSLDDTSSPRAYNFYLQADTLYHQYNRSANKRAIELFEQATKLDSSFVAAYAGLANAYLQGIYRFEYPEKESLEKVFCYLETGFKIDNQVPQLYKAQGLAYAIKGMYQNSIAANLKAVELSPEYLDAITNLTFAYSKSGMLNKALYWGKKAVLKDTSAARGYEYLAQTFSALEMNQEAERWFEDALKIKPNHSLVIKFYSRHLLATGNYSKAKALVEKLFKTNPEEYWVYNLLGDIAYFTGEIESAWSYYVEAEELSGGRAKEYAQYRMILLSVALKKKNVVLDLDKQLGIFLNRVESADENPELYFQIAVLYALQKSKSKSIKWLQKAVDRGWLSTELTVKEPVFYLLKESKEFQQVLLTMSNKINKMKSAELSLF